MSSGGPQRMGIGRRPWWCLACVWVHASGSRYAVTASSGCGRQGVVKGVPRQCGGGRNLNLKVIPELRTTEERMHYDEGGGKGGAAARRLGSSKRFATCF